MLGNRVWATFTFFINDMNNKSSMTKQSQNQDQLPLDTRYHFVHKALNKKLKALSENVNNRALLSSFHADQSINLLKKCALMVLFKHVCVPSPTLALRQIEQDLIAFLPHSGLLAWTCISFDSNVFVIFADIMMYRCC